MKCITVWFLMIRTAYGELGGPVDLGYGFDPNTLYWPGMPEFNLTSVLDMHDPFYMTSKKFDAAEHGGTHLDAPFHFNPEGWTVADIPLDKLMVPGVVIHMREAAEKDPDTEVAVSDLEEWEKKYGLLPDQVAVIFDFGWASKYRNRTEYFGMQDNNENELHFPGVSEGAAEWLANSSKVVGVGVDTPSVDRGINKEFSAHRVLCAANIYLMENLALNGTDLPHRGFQLYVMPMKIVNGSGAPLRIIAQPTKHTADSFFARILSWVMYLWVTMTSVF